MSAVHSPSSQPPPHVAGRPVGTAILTLLALCAVPRLACAVDDWGIQNQRIPWSQGSEGYGLDGACYGMVQVQVAYHRLGLDKTQPLTAVTGGGSSAGHTDASRRLFVEQFAGLAQNYSLRNRDAEKEIYSQTTAPADVDASVAAHLSADSPQVLVLSNEKVASRDSAAFRAHAVLVETREEDGDLVRYGISDPNVPGQRGTITYDKTTGAFSGYAGYDTVRHDQSTLPEQNRKWLDALIQGASKPEHETYLPVWRGNNDQPKSEEEYRKQKTSEHGLHIIEPPVPSTGLDRKVEALRTEEVGGVRLYFDPVIVADDEFTPERWRMLQAMTEELTAGRESFLIRSTERETLQAVRLDAVLDAATGTAQPTIGDLTRIAGLARNTKTGDIFILGRREPDRQPIPLDVLTVALRLIWRQGLAPAVSLDPDPSDFYGPQRVRLESIPDDCRATEFVRTMLEADYAMKRIMLGEDSPGLAGYQSAYDLLAADPGNSHPEYVRLWLYPRETAGAEVYTAVSGDVETFYFDSDVELLTENMKLAQNLLVGTGTQDSITERAALLFTQYYTQIENLRPVFRDLHGVFDAAKLAAVLRARGIQSEKLQQAADRAVAPVAIAESYPGIGPKAILGTGDSAGIVLYVGGGVQNRGAVNPADLVKVPGLLTPAGQAALTGETPAPAGLQLGLPTAIPLDATQARQSNSELETASALSEVMAGEPEAAISRLTRLLTADPTLLRTRAVRALAYMIGGDQSAALHDADIVVQSDASLRALRGQIRACAGDSVGALADVNAAAVAAPGRAEVLVQKAWVEVHTMQWEPAEKDLARLATMNPLDPDIAALRQDLRLFRRLSPDRVRAYVRSRLAMPLAVGVMLQSVQAAQSRGDVEEALRLLEKALPAARAYREPLGGSLYLEERCWVLLAIVYGERGQDGDSALTRKYLEDLAQRHPDWPSALLLRINYDHDLPVAQALRLYGRAAAMNQADDPILLEAEVRGGLDFRAQFGLELIMRAMPELEKDKTLDAAAVAKLVDTVKGSVPSGLTSQLLGWYRKMVSGIDLRRRGEHLNEAEYAQLDAQLGQFMLNPPPLPPHPAALELRTLELLYAPFLSSQAVERESEETRGPTDTLFRNFVKGINSDWSSFPVLEQAANASLRTHGIYAQVLVKRIQKQDDFTRLTESGKQGGLTVDQAVAALDSMADAEVARLGKLPPFSQALLRVELISQYPVLLNWADRDEVDAKSRTRLQKLMDQLADTPVLLVELKAAALWFDHRSHTLPESVTDRAAVAKTMAELYRRSIALNLRFTARAASSGSGA